MNIALPTQQVGDLDTRLSDHFGSAPHFAIYNTEKRSLKFITNTFAVHDHGNCRPTEALEGQDIQMVICRGMGRGALQNLNQLGIQVKLAKNAKTLGDAILGFREDSLTDMGEKELCDHHEHPH